MHYIRATAIIIHCLVSAFIVLIFSWLPRGGVYPFISRKFWGPGLLKIAGATLKAEGLEHIPTDRACIFFANHQSNYDIPSICAALPVPVYYIAKRELLKVPVFGWGMYAIGMVFVDRSNPEKARKSMLNASKTIKKGKHIITFPEGTRSRKGELQVFKKGTFHLAKTGSITLVPVAITGTRKVLPPGGKIGPGAVLVEVGMPISADEVERLSVNELTALALNRIQALLEKQNRQTAEEIEVGKTH